jgi:transcriptional regulator with XRE-family HTH domain
MTAFAEQVGMSQQQYQRLEAGGVVKDEYVCPNPTLKNLKRVADALESELVLVPRAKIDAVNKILAAIK